ncbi:MAG: hypothetical protein AAF502_05485 [Bacteroidota bacterium]
MSFFFRISLLLGVLISFAGCTQKISQPTQDQAQVSDFRYLDLKEARQIIIQDEAEGFFDLIEIIDMQIQLKDVLIVDGLDERTVYHEAYKSQIATEVMEFTDAEKAWIDPIMNEALELSAKLSPGLPNKEVLLLKMNGNHYGNGVYYTRENAILIPQNVIAEGYRNTTDFLQVMLHEIFHIYSRYHPNKKKELYQLIGFQPADPFEFPSELKEQKLLNPDGIDVRYMISLEDKEGRTLKAVPVIYTTADQFDESVPDFFSYLNFDFFELIDGSEGKTLKVTDPLGSTINLREVTGFWEQVSRNSNYIIHPDELMADNFAILALSKKDPKILDGLEPKGLDILLKIEETIK